MTEEWKEIAEPAILNQPTAASMTSGPPISPQQRLLLYSADQWEEFIEEWAYYCLRARYMHVQRFSGAGDRGIDIAGFTDAFRFLGVWDNYQCKHYDHALYPTDIWVDAPPRHYYFVAPRGVGTTVGGLFANAKKLKEQLMVNWDRYVRKEISSTIDVVLEGELLAYFETFDFTIFDSKTALQLIEDHCSTPRHAMRFGGGLKSRPTSPAPPMTIASSESRYVSKLLAAYTQHKGVTVSDAAALGKWPPIKAHFSRQREAFYEAEALRIFARDSVPSGTFEALQEDIYGGVVDVHDGPHADGYARVVAVTKSARDLQITANPLISCTKPKDRDGICHQLANDDRFQWTQS
jgi:hypothetical protein